MKKETFVFESAFPSSLHELRNLVFCNMSDYANVKDEVSFNALEQDKKDRVKRLEINEDGISIELHDAVEASVCYEQMLNKI